MEWPPQDAAPGPLQHGVASLLAEEASTVTLLDSNFSPWWDDVIHSQGLLGYPRNTAAMPGLIQTACEVP